MRTQMDIIDNGFNIWVQCEHFPHNLTFVWKIVWSGDFATRVPGSFDVFCVVSFKETEPRNKKSVRPKPTSLEPQISPNLVQL